MDSVKNLIAQKRKQLENDKLIGNGKSYFKRCELRKVEDQRYFANSKRHKIDELNQKEGIVLWPDEASGDGLLLKKMEERSREEKEKNNIMPRREVVRLLRERAQPIRIFGESDYDTFQRLKRIQLLEPESKGLRNDLIAAFDKLDDAEDEEFYTTGRRKTLAEERESAKDVDDSEGKSRETSTSDVVTKADILKSPDFEKMKVELASYVMLKEGTATDDATSAVISISKAALGDDSRISLDIEDEQAIREQATAHVLHYFKFLLAKWGHALNSRPKEDKFSYAGKMHSATYTQTVEYIKPLFKALHSNCCKVDILDSLVKISVLLLDRNYIKANDAYLELAIGNAPWPLGVTNHGIHSRTAQEKIYAKNVAHVLNDETQRKYIQAIKRLMTQAQKFYSTDPSKCVNYMGSS